MPLVLVPMDSRDAAMVGSASLHPHTCPHPSSASWYHLSPGTRAPGPDLQQKHQTQGTQKTQNPNGIASSSWGHRAFGGPAALQLQPQPLAP